MAATEVRAALAAAAAVGPYFEIVLEGDRDGWLPLTRLLLPETVRLDDQVNAVRAVLAERSGLTPDGIDLRACASTSFLGMASRIIGPALAAGTMGAVVPVFDPAALFWQPSTAGPIPIAVFQVDGSRTATVEEAASAVHRGVISPVISPLVEAYAAHFRLSRQVLWGNVASALAGAASMLEQPGPSRLGPTNLVEAILRFGPLNGSGHYEPPDVGRRQRFFVRHNCCLFYRIPNGGYCGDCVLADGAARITRWRA